MTSSSASYRRACDLDFSAARVTCVELNAGVEGIEGETAVYEVAELLRGTFVTSDLTYRDCAGDTWLGMRFCWTGPRGGEGDRRGCALLVSHLCVVADDGSCCLPNLSDIFTVVEVPAPTLSSSKS